MTNTLETGFQSAVAPGIRFHSSRNLIWKWVNQLDLTRKSSRAGQPESGNTNRKNIDVLMVQVSLWNILSDRRSGAAQVFAGAQAARKAAACHRKGL